MMIAHLFNKIYLSFDFMFQPAFNTLVVSKNAYSPHRSFINQHIGFGVHHGSFANHPAVDWKTFFTTATDRRTVIYADAVNFAVIYFSFLKTIKPYIKKSAAIKILEIVLKRTEFVAEYWNENRDAEGAVDKKNKTLQITAEIRSSIDQAWTACQAFDLSAEYVQRELGIEFLLAQYWANGSQESLVKEKLESMWWKTFVCWGEEFFKLYLYDWMYRNPGMSKEFLLAELLTNNELSWMADPNLNENNVDQFRQNHDWSTISKIFKQLTSNQHNSIMVELNGQFKNIVDKNWSLILDKSNPLSLLAVFTEPAYRSLANGWLISYFAAQSPQKLKEIVS